LHPTYHFISHSHWDREWYKSYETFRLDLVDMINSLLDIFTNNHDYKHFTLDGQTIVLEDYAEIMPGRKAELRRLVQEERISIGPWYILPDEFLVSGESTIRNLHFGRKAGEPYGSVMQIGYIPDSFAHLAMMPAILRGFDMDTAIVFRGFGGEPGQEKSEYRWRSPDDSEVLMIHLPPNGYGDAYVGENSTEAFRQKGEELKSILDPRATTPLRLCMNGGDHHFPEPYLPEALQVMTDGGGGTFIHSSLPKYVHALKDYLEKENVPLRLIEGELRWGFRYAFAIQSGVYSSRMYLKQANHACEKLLTHYSEPMAIWAALVGRENLAPMLHQAWKILLQNHPHDSICGCSVDQVHQEMMTRFEKCQQIGDSVIEKSLRHLYADEWEGPERILIFNPVLRTTSCPVEAEIEFFRQIILVGLNPNVHPEPIKPLISGFRILDPEGKDIPFQIFHHETEGHGLRYSDYSYPSKRLVERFHILVDAKDVPGLGFAYYRVEKTDRLPTHTSGLRTGEAYVENDYLRVEAQANGSLQVHDKRNGQSFTNFLLFEDGGDAGDEYNYSHPAEDLIVSSKSAKAEISLIESGPLRAALAIRFDLKLPACLKGSRQSRTSEMIDLPISTKVSLYHNQPWIECETRVENSAEDHRLRVLFPTKFQTCTSYADGQFCITKREHHPVEDPEDFTIEMPTVVHPMQRCVTILDGNRGLTVATEGLPEYEVKTEDPGTLAITLLRCVGRLSGGDLLTRPGGEAGWITETPEAQCRGVHTFRYAIIPHSETEFTEYGYVNERIEAFLFPFRAQRRGGNPQIQLDQFGMTLSPSSLVVSTFKPAEDGSGYILRFYNPTAREISGELNSAYKLKEALWTQLNERDGDAVEVENRHLLQFSVDPYKTASLRLLFEG
jgi:alpha-mannosidase